MLIKNDNQSIGESTFCLSVHSTFLFPTELWIFVTIHKNDSGSIPELEVPELIIIMLHMIIIVLWPMNLILDTPTILCAIFTINMEAQSLVWVQKELLGKVYCSAAGKRDKLIISSEAPLPHPDAVPRCNAELTEDDRRRLTNQGVPEHCCDDLSTVRARCNLDKGVNVVGVEVSGPEKMLSRDYI